MTWDKTVTALRHLTVAAGRAGSIDDVEVSTNDLGMTGWDKVLVHVKGELSLVVCRREGWRASAADVARQFGKEAAERIEKGGAS